MQRDHFLISKQAQYYSALAPTLIQIYKAIPLATHPSYLPQITGAYNKFGPGAGPSLYFTWQPLMYTWLNLHLLFSGPGLSKLNFAAAIQEQCVWFGVFFPFVL